MSKSILIALALLALISNSNAREYQSAQCPRCQTASEWAASDAEYCDTCEVVDCDDNEDNAACSNSNESYVIVNCSTSSNPVCDDFTDSDVGCTDDCLDSETN